MTGGWNLDGYQSPHHSPMTQKNIHLNEQNDIEAIIGNPPGWTLRWGMTLIFFAVALFAFIAWFVRYPDIIEAPAVLTTEQPPIRVVSKMDARLIELKTANGNEVNKGDILAVLESSAEWKDVEVLNDFLDNLNQNEPGAFLAIKWLDDLKIGTLETSFARLGQSFSELKYFLEHDINFLKISNLKKQIIDLERLNISLEKQAAILADEVDVAFLGYERDSLLEEKKSASQVEFESSKSQWLRKKRELENLISGTIQNDLEIRQMEAQILDLRQLRNDSENEKLLTFENDLEKLKGEIEIWKNTYLIEAPISGKVTLTNKWSAQQFVNAGEEVLTIVPPSESGEIFVRLMLSGPNIGKVEPEMTVFLRLDAFPYQEHGVLNGSLKNVAEARGEKGYEAHVILPNGMETNYGKEIPFRQEMKATGRIVTEERSYLKRILEKFWANFEEN